MSLKQDLHVNKGQKANSDGKKYWWKNHSVGGCTGLCWLHDQLALDRWWNLVLVYTVIMPEPKTRQIFISDSTREDVTSGWNKNYTIETLYGAGYSFRLLCVQTDTIMKFCFVNIGGISWSELIHTWKRRKNKNTFSGGLVELPNLQANLKRRYPHLLARKEVTKLLAY